MVGDLKMILEATEHSCEHIHDRELNVSSLNYDIK